MFGRPDAPYICVFLPFPPTVNNLFSNFTRNGKQMRVPTKAYKAWQDEAARVIEKQRPLPSVSGPIEIRMSFGRPDRRRRDIFNYVKAPEDMIVKAGLIEDDSLVERGFVEWDKDIVGVRVEVSAFVETETETESEAA